MGKIERKKRKELMELVRLAAIELDRITALRHRGFAFEFRAERRHYRAAETRRRRQDLTPESNPQTAINEIATGVH